jgi:hypothetical protein
MLNDFAVDTSADSELWCPHFADSLNMTKHSLIQYPPTKSYTVTAFVNSCKLSIIIHDIITTLYYRRDKSTIETAFQEIQDHLENWRAQSPREVKLDPDNLPSICPPPHIVSQKYVNTLHLPRPIPTSHLLTTPSMLYYASIILTHRPFWTVPQCYSICLSASQSIASLVLLLETTFGLDNITYLMGYCIYTGASVSLEDAKETNNPDHPTLRTFLRALNAGMRRCSLLERSLNIIIKKMSHAFYEDGLLRRAGTEDAAPETSGYIPAFPYIDPMGNGGVNFDWYASGADSGAMNLLDCFPETQMDWTGMFGNVG